MTAELVDLRDPLRLDEECVRFDAVDRELHCELQDQCASDAARNDWAGWACTGCPVRGRATPARTELLAVHGGRAQDTTVLPDQRSDSHGAPARRLQQQQQQQFAQEQAAQLRATRARVRQENWAAKTAAFWAPAVVEVLPVSPPTPPPARPARELRGPSAPRQRGVVHEDADVELREVPLPELEVDQVDDEELELVHPEKPAPRSALDVLEERLEREVVAIAQELAPELLRPTPPRSPRPPMPLAPVVKREGLPTLQAARERVEQLRAELAGAEELLGKVVAAAEAELEPARALLGPRHPPALEEAVGEVFGAAALRTLKKRPPRQPTTIQQRLVNVLQDGKEHRVAELAAQLGEREPAVSHALAQLAKKNAATKTGRLWRSSSAPATPAPPPKVKSAPRSEGGYGSLRSSILEALADGAARSRAEVAAKIGRDPGDTGTSLAQLAQAGALCRPSRGVYQLAKQQKRSA